MKETKVTIASTPTAPEKEAASKAAFFCGFAWGLLLFQSFCMVALSLLVWPETYDNLGGAFRGRDDVFLLFASLKAQR